MCARCWWWLRIWSRGGRRLPSWRRRWLCFRARARRWRIRCSGWWWPSRVMDRWYLVRVVRAKAYPSPSRWWWRTKVVVWDWQSRLKYERGAAHKLGSWSVDMDGRWNGGRGDLRWKLDGMLLTFALVPSGLISHVNYWYLLYEFVGDPRGR